MTGSTTPAEELSKEHLAIPVPKDEAEDGLTVASNPVSTGAVPDEQIVQQANQQLIMLGGTPIPFSEADSLTARELASGMISAAEAENRGFCIACFTPNIAHRRHLDKQSCVRYSGSRHRPQALSCQRPPRGTEQRTPYVSTPQSGFPTIKSGDTSWVDVQSNAACTTPDPLQTTKSSRYFRVHR